MPPTNLHDLPGGVAIAQGLADLRRGDASTEHALLASIATVRLRELGLAVSMAHVPKDPELKLYALLQQQCDDPYGYYNSLVAQLVSFCQALEQRRWREQHA